MAGRFQALTIAMLAAASLAATPVTSPSAPPAPSVWRYFAPLAQPALHVVLGTKGPSRVVVIIESYDVRRIAGVQVARLAGMFDDADSRGPLGSSLPGQVAVSPRGVRLFGANASDRVIRAGTRSSTDHHRQDPARPGRRAALPRARRRAAVPGQRRA